MYKNRSIQNNPCDVASSRAWRLVWEGGLDLLTRPMEGKKHPEVDNWTNWPPGQITGSTEDSIMKRPASNPLQPNNKVKISAVSHPLHCLGCFWSMKFIRGTCWILPSCSCVLVEAESNSTERHTVQNRSLVCRVTDFFLGNETKISSAHSLTIFGKVKYTSQSANFVFHQRARCDRIYAFICFSSQNYWAVSKVCGKALMSAFFYAQS